MKQYPSIDGNIIHKPIIAQEKHDGSNIRAEWSRKRGFYKFGTRRRLMDGSDPQFGSACELIREGFEETLTSIFKKLAKKKPALWSREVTCFFEFFGENSFAGQHDPNDKMQVVLFDVSPRGGFVDPWTFHKTFSGDVQTVKSLYEGNPTQDFLNQVRNGTLPGMPFEGVVCKGRELSPGRPLMFKVKNHAWIEAVKARYGHDQKLLEKLL